jgi:dihydroorotate dehydrogenase electron transfer subunit
MLEQLSHTWEQRGGLHRPARVLDVRVENYRTRTLTLDLRLAARPGQFVMAWLPGVEERPFSLAAADPVMLTVAQVGPFSSAVHQLQPGDRIYLRGPFGNGFTPAGRRALLVGGGYGVAPLAFLAEVLLAQGHAVTAAIGARCAEELLLVDRLRSLGVPLLLTTEDGSQGTPGRVTAVVEPLLRSGDIDTLYACGPHGMLEALETLCQATGTPGQLSWEAQMRCGGLGLCGSCEHGGLLVCRDGPVLPAAAGERQTG